MFRGAFAKITIARSVFARDDRFGVSRGRSCDSEIVRAVTTSGLVKDRETIRAMISPAICSECRRDFARRCRAISRGEALSGRCHDSRLRP